MKTKMIEAYDKLCGACTFAAGSIFILAWITIEIKHWVVNTSYKLINFYHFITKKENK